MTVGTAPKIQVRKNTSSATFVQTVDLLAAVVEYVASGVVSTDIYLPMGELGTGRV